MKPIPASLVPRLIECIALGLFLFLVAGTFNYWQAWVFLVVFNLSGWIPSIYLLRKNPAALERRIRGGPTAETRMVQKVLSVGWLSSLVAVVVVSALDYRFGWSRVPTAICLIGDVLVAVGLSAVMLVVIQNSYAAATVQVEEDQKLVSNGLYRLVRHPMYTCNVIMMIGVALALGSYWGLVTVLSAVIVLALRIRDEEKLLRQELIGYREYVQTVRYRLVPHIW